MYIQYKVGIVILEEHERDAHHSFLLFCKLTSAKAAQWGDWCELWCGNLVLCIMH